MRLPSVLPELLLVLALGATPGGIAQASGTNDARYAGLRLYAAGQFREAIPFFDQVIASHERDQEILIKRGVCYVHANRPLDALADFDQVNLHSGWSSSLTGGVGILNTTSSWITAPAPDVNYAENWGNRGIALLMLGRDEEALESFRTSVSLWSQPQNQPGAVAPQYRAMMVRGRAGAYEGFGQSYHRLGQDEQAYSAYSQAIAIDPSDANGYAGRGDVLASLKLLDAAEADYSEAIRLDAGHSRAHCGLGVLRYERHQDDLALADFDRAIALDADYARAYSYRGGLRARRGENERALADYDALVRLLPASAGAYKDRGGVLVRMNRFDGAIADLTEAIRLNPRLAAAFQNRGAAYNGLGQYERAIDDLTQAIDLNHDNAGAYTNRGLAHFAAGQYDQAVADLSQAVQLAPQNAVPYFNRAEVFARLGLRDRALQDYDRAGQLEPRISAAFAASARLREENGQRGHAIHDLDMALQLAPEEVGLYRDRGNARRESGDWQGALADYDRAVVLAPRQAEHYVARGWARLGAGIDGADFDARVYLKLKGWRDPQSPYMAILAVLGAGQAHRRADAQPVLDESLANLSPSVWPVPVLRFMHGQITESALFKAASSARQKAEAHAFVGIDLLRAGDRQGTIRHLRESQIHATAGSIAADVASATLDRIEPAAR